MYEVGIIPIPSIPLLIGSCIRSLPLLTGVPYQRYTVIIPLYNKEKTILDCLKSVFSQTKKPYEVIVVDDCSTDYSFEKVYYSEFKEKIILLKNFNNIGKAKTINRALSFVTTPFVLILDADTVLEPTFVHHAMKGFYDRRVKAVCGSVLPLSNNSLYSKSRLIEYALSVGYKKFQTKINGMWVVTGCASMWRTAYIKKIGFPDTIVEDMELTWQTQSKKDYKDRYYLVAYNPKAICYTSEPETLESFVNQLSRWYSFRNVLSKHFREVCTSLKLNTLWVFGEFGMFSIYSGLLLYSLLTLNFLSLLGLITVDFVLTLILAVHNARQLVKVKDVLKSLPSYFLLRPLNCLLFLKCLIKPKRKW